LDPLLLRKAHILGFIPARGNSKGVRSKNKRNLNGHPLVSYTIRSALQSTSLTRTIVSTEDAEIAQIARDMGADIPYLRPSRLSADSSSLQDVLLDVIRYYEHEEDWRVDMVVTMLPTTPFRSEGVIDRVIEKLCEESMLRGAGQCILLAKLRTHPLRCFIFSEDTDYVRPLVQDASKLRNQSSLSKLHRNFMSVSAEWVRLPRRVMENNPHGVFFWADLNRVLPEELECLFHKQWAGGWVPVTPDHGGTLSDLYSIDIDEPLDFLKAQAIIESCPWLENAGAQRILAVPDNFSVHRQLTVHTD